MRVLKELGIESNALPISFVDMHEYINNNTHKEKEKNQGIFKNSLSEENCPIPYFIYDAILITDDVSWQIVEPEPQTNIYTTSRFSYNKLEQCMLNANVFLIDKALKSINQRVVVGHIKRILHMQTKSVFKTSPISDVIADKITVCIRRECKWLDKLSNDTIEQLKTNQYHHGLVLFNQQEAECFIGLCEKYQLLPFSVPIFVPHYHLKTAVKALSDNIVVLSSDSDISFAQNIESYLYETGRATNQQITNGSR